MFVTQFVTQFVTLFVTQFVTFRGFSTERARLGTFRGFGTERARLGTFKKNLKKMLFFYSKRAKTRAKPEV